MIKDTVGGLLQGAIAFSGDWIVRAENDAPSPLNARCQIGTATFPALSLNNVKYSNVVAFRFKPISGREDQAAGIIFRIQDMVDQSDTWRTTLSSEASSTHLPCSRRCLHL